MKGTEFSAADFERVYKRILSGPAYLAHPSSEADAVEYENIVVAALRLASKPPGSGPSIREVQLPPIDFSGVTDACQTDSDAMDQAVADAHGAGQECGANEERAAIVAWLRERAPYTFLCECGHQHIVRFGKTADAIEAASHLGGKPE